MYEARSSEDIWIYESIVIEFFIRLKIHNIGTCVLKFDIKNLVFIVSLVNYETLAMQCHAGIFKFYATWPIRRPISPTAHWSDDPLVRRPIGPTVHWSAGSLVLRYRIAVDNKFVLQLFF